MTVRLDTIEKGKKFRCPWNDQIFVLDSITDSAAWVQVIETREAVVIDSKTKMDKTIKFTQRKNEPWSRGTQVEPVNE